MAGKASEIVLLEGFNVTFNSDMNNTRDEEIFGGKFSKTIQMPSYTKFALMILTIELMHESCKS